MKTKFMIVGAFALLFMVQSCTKKKIEAPLPPVIVTPVDTTHRTPPTPTPPVSDYGTYVIKCFTETKYIEATGDLTYNQKYNDHAKLVKGVFSFGVLWQKWQVEYRKTVDSVKYYTIMNLHSGKVMNVVGGVTASDQKLEQLYYSGEDQQLWKIVPVDTSGYYHIVNKKSGLAVTYLNSSVSDTLVQQPLGKGDNQKWVFGSIPADSYRDDEITRYFQRDNKALGSVAWDQGNSIPLTWSSNDGKVLWVTQDAWDGSSFQSNMKFPCNYFFSYNNSIIIQQSKTDWTPDDPNMTINSPMGRPKQICSNQAGTDWSWPGPGVEITDKVYIQCGEGNGLTATNQSLYVLTQSTGTLWTSQRTAPAGMSGQARINYAVGMIKDSDGYVYAYGAEGTSFGYASNIYVARFPQSNPQSWTFWNGSGWGTDINTSAIITTSLANTSVVYCNGKYVLATMDCAFNCDVTRNIYTSTATNLTGPFSSKVQIYKLNDYFYGKYTRAYTLICHPEFDNGRNELLITYAVNYSACGVSECQGGWIDPNYYRIRALRIPYSKMGM